MPTLISPVLRAFYVEGEGTDKQVKYHSVYATELPLDFPALFAVSLG